MLLLALGITGFIPGFVSDYDYLAAGDHIAGWILLGTFQVSPLHNAFHLLIGGAGLKLAGSVRGAWHFLLWGGFAYLALCLYGRATDRSTFKAMPLNNADDWLHLFLGVTMVGLALLLARGRGRPSGGRDEEGNEAVPGRPQERKAGDAGH